MTERIKNFINSFSHFYNHLHFKEIDSNITRFRATFFAGIILVISFIVLAITGIFLMYYYIPTSGGAWQSMQIIEGKLSTGSLMRTLHYVAAQLMVVSLLFHILSLILRKAYDKKRATNWTLGIILFIITVMLSYTGYLLPYDQLAYWAITVGANMANSAPFIGPTIKNFMIGGSEIGTTTILRFYVHHCVTLPLIFIIVLFLHVYRIRKDGGLKLSFPKTKKYKREKVVKFELYLLIFFLLIMAIISINLKLDLGFMANSEITPNPMKAPWYLIGLQELLHFYPPFFVTYIVPSLFFLFLFFIPTLPERYQNRELRSLSSKKLFSAFTLLSLPILSSIFVAYHIDFTIIVVTLIFIALLFFSSKKHIFSNSFGKNTILTFILLYLLTIYFVMTIVAYYFRGENWEFILL